MATEFQVTFDSAGPRAHAAFPAAVHYVQASPVQRGMPDHGSVTRA